MHFHPQDKSVYPLLVPAILEAEPGGLVGPLQVEGGYSVFRVESRDAAGIEPYDSVQRRARAMLWRQRENQSLERLIESLRDKYAASITIHEDRLVKAWGPEQDGDNTPDDRSRDQSEANTHPMLT